MNDSLTNSTQSSISVTPGNVGEIMRNAIKILEKQKDIPRLESIASRHDLTEILKLDIMTKAFVPWGGVRYFKNSSIPKGKIRTYYSDGTVKDYPFTKSPLANPTTKEVE